jgi:hypothetical protein
MQIVRKSPARVFLLEADRTEDCAGRRQPGIGQDPLSVEQVVNSYANEHLHFLTKVNVFVLSATVFFRKTISYESRPVYRLWLT